MKSKLLPKLRQIVFTFQKANSMRKGMNWTLELQQRAQTFLGERDPVNSLWNLSTYIWWMWAEWQPLSAVLAAVLVRGVLYSSEESRPPCCRETGGCFRFGQHGLSFTTALFGRNCWNQRRCSTLQVLIAEALRPLKGGGRALTHLSSSAFTHKILSGASVGAYPYCVRQLK